MYPTLGEDGIVHAVSETKIVTIITSMDLLPKLQTLSIPTLVIWGDHDFFPIQIAAHIARAIPNAQLVTLKDCGHFAYLECPGDVRNAFNDFFRRTRAAVRPH